MLVGVPGVGKSTYTAKYFPDYTLVSSDIYIEAYAQTNRKTYTEVHREAYKHAEKLMYIALEEAFQRGDDIVWDQTNLNEKSRAKKLKMVPRGYTKIAVYFKMDNVSEWRRRLDSRPGKTIPQYVLESMLASIEEPTILEGFKEVRVVENC